MEERIQLCQRGDSLQASPAHKNALEVFPLAFPFERADLAPAFPSCRGKLTKTSPKGLKNQNGLVGAVVIFQDMTGRPWGAPQPGHLLGEAELSCWAELGRAELSRARCFPPASNNVVREGLELRHESCWFSLLTLGRISAGLRPPSSSRGDRGASGVRMMVPTEPPAPGFLQKCQCRRWELGGPIPLQFTAGLGTWCFGSQDQHWVLWERWVICHHSGTWG